MTRLRTGVLSLLSVLAFQAVSGMTLSMHCGDLLQLERLPQDAEVAFVKLDEALKNKRIIPSAAIPEGWVERRGPEDGKVFVVLTVGLADDRTIGCLDYVLISGESKSPCLGISVGRKRIFDPRWIQVKGPREVRMVFAAPADACTAILKCAYESVPVPEIRLTLQEPPPPPEPEPPAKQETPAAEVGGKTPAAAEEGDSGLLFEDGEEPVPAVKRPAPAGKTAAKSGGRTKAPGSGKDGKAK